MTPVFALEPERFTQATGVLLALATAMLGLGLERLVRGSRLVAGAVLAVGIAATLLAFSLRVEGSSRPGTFLLLTREACPHCDEARAILDSLQSEYGFDVWEVDVTDEADLARKYGDEVPVLFHDEEKVASLEVREAAIRNRLDPS